MALHVAFTSTKPDKTGIVPLCFAGSPYLLILDADTGDLVHSETFPEDGEADMARLVLQWKCEGIVCGLLEKEPFDILALEGFVTRYDGTGMTISEALEKMNGYELNYISDHLGGTGCPTDAHDHGTFCGGDHDHGHDHDHHHGNGHEH